MNGELVFTLLQLLIWCAVVSVPVFLTLTIFRALRARHEKSEDTLS